jgi:hypothetical protein
MKTLEPLKKNYLKLNKENMGTVLANWQSDFNLIIREVTFLKKLLETYPFKVAIPNLFEDLQLFREELNAVKDTGEKINEQIKNSQNQKEALQIKKTAKLIQNNNNIQKIELEIITLHKKYQKLKIALYEYITGLLTS